MRRKKQALILAGLLVVALGATAKQKRKPKKRRLSKPKLRLVVGGRSR